MVGDSARRRRPRGLINGAEACALLGITPRRLNDLMRDGVLIDIVFYGWKPWFRAKDVRRLVPKYRPSQKSR